ncbi:Nucleoside-diphosphate-sugar epimerase [Arboricoccus pini]|uniref:Nucleoside-diphosphate-sugar epimerase n=1 Tax=Arboricoccus pini TaxID=1963835 RepID=A0A212R242_9PROT|nr:SDR family oxidoreductase [Arboricoccus pini]SNB66079.1 Nucleoside-diphosphate-sugar epimerase [Arboricoccus pini]
MPEVLFCFGLGYTAKRLAAALASKGWIIRGTARTAAKVAELRQEGIEAFEFAGLGPLQEASTALSSVTHVLHSIPPDPEGDPVLRWHAADLAALPGLAWLGWLGSTSVYGNRDGAWVDEETPLLPAIARADRRAAAERDWLASGLPTHIFRLAGIYGPGRNAFVTLRQGTARRIVKPGQVFSRIHVDDIVRVLMASIAKPSPGRIYNVCDDEPAPSQDVVGHAAKLMGVPPPPELPFETAELPPMARSFYSANRRVRNERIKRELGVTLAFPTYREGLAALLREAENS